MPLPRALRLLGTALCLVVPGPEVVGWLTRSASAHGPWWLASYALFVGAFHLGATAPDGPRGRTRNLVALGLEEGAMLGMALAAPCDFAALALVVAALHAALFLGDRALGGVLLAQTVVMSALVMRGCGAALSVSWLLAVAGFQAAAAVAAVLGRREGEARADLQQANVELRAARALLTEATRADERHRIARELHDVLGHNLTALGLHLEVARSVAVDKAMPHLTKAGGLAEASLADLRKAVGALRDTRGPDAGRALRELCADIPGLHVHLDLPEPLIVEGAGRAQCVVRCVQEILTNTLRHARARNLWIRVERTDGFLTVDARDDGQGAPAVHAGHGLAGMRERIEEIGGRLAVEAAPAFSVRARLPLEGIPS